jgi:hypothetical protein
MRLFRDLLLSVGTVVSFATTVLAQEPDSLPNESRLARRAEVGAFGGMFPSVHERLPGYDTNCQLLASALCNGAGPRFRGGAPYAAGPAQEGERESRGKVAARGLFWGALIGGVIGYSSSGGSSGERWLGGVGGALLGAPVGMVVYLIITPL